MRATGTRQYFFFFFFFFFFFLEMRRHDTHTPQRSVLLTPVILLHLLPLAVLAPWWRPGMNLKRWYGGVLLALLGTAIG